MIITGNPVVWPAAGENELLTAEIARARNAYEDLVEQFLDAQVRAGYRGPVYAYAQMGSDNELRIYVSVDLPTAYDPATSTAIKRYERDRCECGRLEGTLRR